MANSPQKYSRQDGSLRDAAEWVRLGLRAPGVICPCCGQMAAMRKRHFNATMAATMVLLYRHQITHPEETWVHVERLLKSVNFPTRGDFYKCKYWDLLQRKPVNRPDGNPNTGFYRLTPVGERFVQRQVEVPNFVWVFNDEPVSFSAATTGILAAMGTRFNYQHLMEGR